MHTRRLIVSRFAQNFRQRFNDSFSQFHIVVGQFATLNTEPYHRSEPALSQICGHVIPFAGIHRNGILQGAEIAGSRIAGRGGSEIISAGIVHAGEGRAEIMRGLQCRPAGVHTFDIEIILAPIVYVHNTRTSLRARFTKPLQATAFTFEETFRAECSAFTVFAHNAGPFFCIMRHVCETM